jgi:ABC-type methionine transport system ATPase subunit
VDAAPDLAAAADAGASLARSLFRLIDVRQERGGRTILDGLSVDLPRTPVTAIVGPSGAGKTSLLRLLNRLDDPVSGQVFFAGRPLDSYPIASLRRRLGFVFQTPSMFPGTVADNLRTAVELGGRSAMSSAPDMRQVLGAAGLDPEYMTREASRLSGGEQQRVSLARALMTGPEILLLDEPTSALDPEVAVRLLATIRRLAIEHSVPAIMITHRLSEARQASTFTVMLEAGRLVEAGETNRLFTSASTARARAYLASGD